MTQQIRFNTASERKAYQDGLAIVARKLAGCTRPTAAEREAATLAEGEGIVAKKLGRIAFIKFFGKEPPITRTTAAATRTTAGTTTCKGYGPPAGPRRYHSYVNRCWLPAAL